MQINSHRYFIQTCVLIIELIPFITRQEQIVAFSDLENVVYRGETNNYHIDIREKYLKRASELSRTEFLKLMKNVTFLQENKK